MFITVHSAMFEGKRTKYTLRNAGSSSSITIESFHWAHTSVFFRYTADMLMSNNIQWSMGKKHFHRRYEATHKATSPRFAYIEDAILCV